MLRTTILDSRSLSNRIDGSFSFTQVISHLLLVLLLSVLCKSFQRTLSSRSPSWLFALTIYLFQQYRFPESECKGTAFFWTTKTFGDIFSKNMHYLSFRWCESMETAKKWGKYRAVTRPTLGLFLNEECRMKNEEWRMGVTFSFCEEGRVKNRADTIWTRWRRCFIHII